jgi:hypothetical protein
MAKGASCARTLDHYRKIGWPIVWKVEHWCSFSRKRKDLLGFIDVLVAGDLITLGVQDTTWGQVSARKRKILASPLAYDWLKSPNRQVEIIGWKAPDKLKGRHRWEHKIVEITLKDFIHGRPTDD